MPAITDEKLPEHSTARFFPGNDAGGGCSSLTAELLDLMKLSSPSCRCEKGKVRSAAADLTYLRLNWSSDLLAQPFEKVTRVLAGSYEKLAPLSFL